MSDELDSFWVVDGGGLVSVFVLDTIFDGMMILSSFCFAHSEASEGILDVVWHSRCDCFCDSVVRNVDAKVLS